MQPYQEAAKEINRQGELPLRIAKNVGSTALATGAGFLAGKGLASKVLALTNSYVPVDLAIKGLNKLDPRFGNFINKAMSAGQSFESVRDFISEKAKGGIEEPKENKQKPPEQTNIIKQYSDELYNFLDERIKSGKDLFMTGAAAQINPKFEKVIQQIEKDHKTKWQDVLQTVFGGQAQTQKPEQNQIQQTQPNEQRLQKESQLFELLKNVSESAKRLKG